MSKSLAIKATAERLNVSPGTVRRLIKAGSMPSFRVGHQIRILEDRLQEWADRGGGTTAEKGKVDGA